MACARRHRCVSVEVEFVRALLLNGSSMARWCVCSYQSWDSLGLAAFGLQGNPPAGAAAAAGAAGPSSAVASNAAAAAGPKVKPKKLSAAEQAAAAAEPAPSPPRAGGPAATLIVCPVSVISNWQTQVEEHTACNLKVRRAWASLQWGTHTCKQAAPCLWPASSLCVCPWRMA